MQQGILKFLQWISHWITLKNVRRKMRIVFESDSLTLFLWLPLDWLLPLREDA
jgi:hypothetical protein